MGDGVGTDALLADGGGGAARGDGRGELGDGGRVGQDHAHEMHQRPAARRQHPGLGGGREGAGGPAPTAGRRGSPGGPWTPADGTELMVAWCAGRWVALDSEDSGVGASGRIRTMQGGFLPARPTHVAPLAPLAGNAVRRRGRGAPDTATSGPPSPPSPPSGPPGTSQHGGTPPPHGRGVNWYTHGGVECTHVGWRVGSRGVGRTRVRTAPAWRARATHAVSWPPAVTGGPSVSADRPSRPATCSNPPYPPPPMSSAGDNRGCWA